MTDAPGVLHPAAVGPGDRTGPALPIDGEWPDDDTCDNPAPCGEQAAVEALRCTWGEAYDIGAEEGLWWFRRKDGVGGTETAAFPGPPAGPARHRLRRLARALPAARAWPTDDCGGTSPRPSPPPSSACRQMEVDAMNNLSRLSPVQLGEAYRAVDYLCEVKDALDAELAIKLGTLRADLAAAFEDRAPVDRVESRAAEAD